MAEDAYTIWYELAPKELAHVQADRTDAGSTDPMRVFIESSVDNGTTIDEIALTEIEIPQAFDRGSLMVMGPHYFRVGMANIGVTDTITVDIHVNRDGGLA